MSKYTDQEIMIHQIRTFGEIVTETGIEPGPGTWPVIAHRIALKYAPQMKPDGSGRPPADHLNNIYRMADVMHYKHETGCTIEKAMKEKGLPLGTKKDFLKKYKQIWNQLKTNPQAAEEIANSPLRNKRDV